MDIPRPHKHFLGVFETKNSEGTTFSGSRGILGVLPHLKDAVKFVAGGFYVDLGHCILLIQCQTNRSKWFMIYCRVPKGPGVFKGG